jgi:arginine N-succinyltransferase
MQLLLDEGFEYENLVDIFDGGPLVRARVERLRSVEAMQVLPCEVTTELDQSHAPMVIASTRLPALTVQLAPAKLEGGKVQLSEITAQTLGVSSGDDVAVLPGLEN